MQLQPHRPHFSAVIVLSRFAMQLQLRPQPKLRTMTTSKIILEKKYIMG
jgi:hypothetical protein